ncbi:MAG: ECF-type sigma factor [Pirellulaceae bacterium]
MTDITQILSQIEDGDLSAAEQLLPLVYDELRKLAAAKLANEKPGQTLQATALVHDAYIRLVDVDKAQHWDSRGHFFAAAAEAMRRILVERARKRYRREAIQGARVAIDGLATATMFPDVALLKLSDALDRLAARNPLAAELVKLRFFAGLNMQQTAQAMRVPLRTAERTWTYARTWLHCEMEKSDD